MSRQIKLLGFIGFLTILFVRTFVIYHPMTHISSNQGFTTFDIVVSSGLFGFGAGLFNAAWTLSQLHLQTFVYFGVASMMLAWMRNHVWIFPLAPGYVVLHLATGFAMTAAFVEALPGHGDLWYWGAFAVSSILAPFSYYVLVGVIGFYLFRNMIRGLISLFT